MRGAKLIAISGASGFVGSNMCRRFKENGWEIIALGRGEFASSSEELAKRIHGVDVVVNLAGAPVISRWSESYRRLLYESRITPTAKLIRACKLMDKPPCVFLSASATGCYAATGTHTEEDNVVSEDFLGYLTRDWEHEAFRAEEFGSRTAIFRLSVVLGKEGGALKKMLLPLRIGLGGTIGNGRQPLSWIHMKDLIRVFETAINDPTYEGIYNLTAPHPTTNIELTKVLGRSLSKPTFLQIPVFVLRLWYREGAQVLTSGQIAIPKRLLDRGFQFDFPTINEAVSDCLKS